LACERYEWQGIRKLWFALETCLNFTPLAASLETEETLTVEAVWRGEVVVTAPISGGVFAIGISDGNLNSGNNIPVLRSDISLGGDQKFFRVEINNSAWIDAQQP
jgi:hypothetical protein